MKTRLFKYFSHAAALTWMLATASCTGEQHFTASQPKDGQTLGAFPAYVRGNYFAKDTESILTIDSNSVTRVYDFDMKCYKDSLPETFKVHGDTLAIYFPEDGSTDYRKITYLPDGTFIFHEHFVDTLFKISEFEVLKMQKGHLFLNDKIQTDSNMFIWEVQKLSYTDGLVSLYYADSPEDISKIEDISTRNKADRFFDYLPKVGHFKVFSDDEDFEKTDSFYKMR
jgi:hypothetical protein